MGNLIEEGSSWHHLSPLFNLSIKKETTKEFPGDLVVKIPGFHHCSPGFCKLQPKKKKRERERKRESTRHNQIKPLDLIVIYRKYSRQRAECVKWHQEGAISKIQSVRNSTDIYMIPRETCRRATQMTKPQCHVTRFWGGLPHNNT